MNAFDGIVAELFQIAIAFQIKAEVEDKHMQSSTKIPPTFFAFTNHHASLMGMLPHDNANKILKSFQRA